MYKVVLVIFFALFLQADECIKCHNIEPFEPKNHNFKCQNCHLKPEHRAKFEHKNIITHPASNEHMEIFCKECHTKEISSYKASNHYTHKNEISKILKTFKIDQNHTLQSIFAIKPNLHTKDGLVIDLLQRKCLKCHTQNQKIYEKGMAHGVGCMACHTDYSNDGVYQGADQNISRQDPHAKTHKMTKPSTHTCMACHNKIYSGADYTGLFPKDHDVSFRSPLQDDGSYQPTKYGSSFHHLSQDIHYQKGLSCASCHKNNSNPRQKVSCQSCHDTKPNQSHAAYHDSLSCSSCHASWQGANYELNLLLDMSKDYAKWTNLTTQEDGYVKKFLNYALEHPNTKPKMPNLLTNKFEDGVWYSGWRLRRWENLLLANSTKSGKIETIRPFFSYRLSFKDKNSTMVFDNIGQDREFEAFMPFTPHTIAKKAKSCEMCHENRLLDRLNLNGVEELFVGKLMDAKELSKEQLDRLHSDKYKLIRSKMFMQN